MVFLKQNILKKRVILSASTDIAPEGILRKRYDCYSQPCYLVVCKNISKFYPIFFFQGVNNSTIFQFKIYNWFHKAPTLIFTSIKLIWKVYCNTSLMPKLIVILRKKSAPSGLRKFNSGLGYLMATFETLRETRVITLQMCSS